MQRLNELAAQLTPAQVKKVEDFAESLIAPPAAVRDERGGDGSGPNRINVDALLGLCAGMGGNKSDKELIREAWDEVVDKLDR
jgi:hypothetical protein